MSQDLRDKLQATLGSAYTLERELGGGGMSRVFVAEDNLLGRKIVVKMLPSDTAAGVSVERFKREIQVVAMGARVRSHAITARRHHMAGRLGTGAQLHSVRRCSSYLEEQRKESSKSCGQGS